MSTPVSVDPPTSLASVITTAGNAASLAAGAVVFIPAAAFLAATGNSTLRDWITWGIPVVVWLVAFAAPSRHARVTGQSFAGFLLVVLAYFDPGSDDWISITTICFAVIVGAVFNLSTRGAAVVVVVAVLLDLATALGADAERALFGVVQLVPWAGGALQLLAGGGLLLAWHSWMRNVSVADAEFEAIKSVVHSDEQVSAAREGTEAVARRIHETILNTLAAMSMGVDPDREAEARAACRRDLEQMNRDVRRLDACGVREVIDSAIATIQPSRLVCAVRMHSDRIVEPRIANALHDAVVEALRNVERHSGQLHADVDVRVDETITIAVRDEGRGAPHATTERFGLRNSLRSNMASINGRVNLEENDRGGTTLTLQAPVEVDRGIAVPTFPILGAADATLIGRLGAAGTNIFMLLILAPVLAAVPDPIPLAITTVAFIGLVVLLAFAWQTSIRPLLNWCGIALLSLPFVVIAWQPLACSVSPALQALVAGASGGAALLLLVANRPLYRRLLIMLLAIAGPLLATLRLPDECRVEPGLTVGVNAVYLVAIVSVLTWIDLRFEVRRAQAQSAWRAFVENQAAREREAAVARGWNLIGPGTRDLLEGVADGSLALSDPEARTRAAAEASSIRSSLGLALEPGDTFGAFTRRLVRVAMQVGATIDAESLTPAQRTDPLPDQVSARIEDMVRRCLGETVSLRAFSDEGFDEIVVTLPRMDTLGESIYFIDDVALQVEVVGDQFIVVVRRPAST